MDHSHMDHSKMDHSHHGGMDMGEDQCNMNMLFTWSTKNLCVVFRQWRVTGPWSLLWTLVAIVLLTAGYECVRSISRRYEQAYEARMSAFSTGASSDSLPRSENPRSYLVLGRDAKASVERQGKMVKAFLYAVQVFYSFFIMLLFMTYNGWIMLAVAVGAFIGYIGFSSDMTSAKSVACH